MGRPLPAGRRPSRTRSSPRRRTACRRAIAGRRPRLLRGPGDRHAVAGPRPGADAPRQRLRPTGTRGSRTTRPRRRSSGSWTRPPPADAESRVLDALLAEARLRWGLDPADGLAVVPAERLIAVPLEPSRPMLLVPLAVLRTTAARRSAGARSRGATVPPAATPSPSCGASTRRITRWGGSARPRPRPSAPSSRADLADRALPRPGRPGAGGRLAVGDALDLEPPAGARRLPVGSRADPRVAAQPPPRGGLRGLRRPRRRRHAGAGRRARRPLAPGGPPRPAGRRGRRLRPGRRPGRDRQQDRPPPPSRVRRRGGAHGDRRQPPVGADQAGGAGRGGGGLGRVRGRRGAGPPARRAPSTG